MKDGYIVESGPVKEVFEDPKEEYTKRMDDLSTPEKEAIAQPNPEALRKAEERRLAAEKLPLRKPLPKMRQKILNSDFPSHRNILFS